MRGGSLNPISSLQGHGHEARPLTGGICQVFAVAVRARDLEPRRLCNERYETERALAVFAGFGSNSAPSEDAFCVRSSGCPADADLKNGKMMMWEVVEGKV